MLRRAAVLFLLGMALQGNVPGRFATYDFHSIRIMGVLQRIAGVSLGRGSCPGGGGMLRLRAAASHDGIQSNAGQLNRAVLSFC